MSSELSGRVLSLENQVSMLTQDMLQKLDLVGASNLSQVWNQQFDSLDDKYFYLKDNLQELQVLYSNLVLNQSTGTTSTGSSNYLQETFETINKNLKEYNHTLIYSTGVLSQIIYDSGTTVFYKTLKYNNDILTGITLSGISGNYSLNKHIEYSGEYVSSITYH